MKKKANFKGGGAQVRKISNKLQRLGYREYLSDLKDSLLSAYKDGKDVDVRPKR